MENSGSDSNNVIAITIVTGMLHKAGIEFIPAIENGKHYAYILAGNRKMLLDDIIDEIFVSLEKIDEASRIFNKRVSEVFA
jgi:hypothetical protein